MSILNSIIVKFIESVLLMIDLSFFFKSHVHFLSIFIALGVLI